MACSQPAECPGKGKGAKRVKFFLLTLARVMCSSPMLIRGASPWWPVKCHVIFWVSSFVFAG
jgi:hypothetical protein